jgi:hypothetical protein
LRCNISANVSTISQTFPFSALYVNIPSPIRFPFFAFSLKEANVFQVRL